MIISPDRIIGPFRGKVTDFGGDIGLTSDLYPVSGSKVLCVLIPPWKTEADYYKLVRKRIHKAGYSCLEYKITSLLISPDYKYTDTAFKEVIRDVKSGIENMVHQYAFEEVQVIGVSIGCIEAAMIANHNPHVTKLVLVAPGSDLAESMWYGLKTQNVRRLFEKQGITLTFLKNAWRDLAPENNFHGLDGKEIEIYISKCDINIPYRFGKRLADAMIAHGLKPRVYENKYLGHYLTVLKYLWKGEIK
jgi:pimeloyl-ACP methyl ester carboxylesterase